MKKAYDLKGDLWREDFFYAYGPQAKDTEKTFTDRDENGALLSDFGEKIDGYDYISAITKKKYTNGVKASVKCTYDGTGAPLIVFSDDFSEKENILRYVLHFEVVAHKDGCNVWRIVPRPETPNWPVASTKIAFLQFDVEPNKEISLSVEILDKTIYVDMNSRKFSVHNDEIPDSFHIGFTGCEGKCTFTEFTVEQ